MGDLGLFVENVVDGVIAAKLPHLKLPAVVTAMITEAVRLDETYTITSGQGYMSAPYFEYALQIVDRFGNPDQNFPEIPGVRARLQVPVGAMVAVGLLGGELNPVLLCEVTL